MSFEFLVLCFGFGFLVKGCWVCFKVIYSPDCYLFVTPTIFKKGMLYIRGAKN